MLLVLTLDIPALKNIKVTLETLELLELPAREVSHRPQPRRRQSRPLDRRGRNHAQGRDCDLHPLRARGACLGESRRADRHRPATPLRQPNLHCPGQGQRSSHAPGQQRGDRTSTSAGELGRRRTPAPVTSRCKARMSTLAERLASAQRDRGQASGTNTQPADNHGAGKAPNDPAGRSQATRAQGAAGQSGSPTL